MRDLIFVSLENWDEIWRRNQFLCSAWARRFPERRILFVGRQQLLPLHLKRGTLGRLLRRPAWRVAGLPNIIATYIPKPLPNPIPGGRAVNEAVARAHIARVAQRAGLRDPLLWINPNDSGHLIGHLGERGVVYDITDDWELAEPDLARRARVAALDRALCRAADLTVVCSQSLYDSRLEFARRLLLLPNGVDAEHYLQSDLPPDLPPQTPASPPAEPMAGDAGGWSKPVFGYTGSLHRDRIDFDIVLALARAFPQGTVALVGPAYWTARSDDAVRAALKAQPNVVLAGPVPYQKVPQAMARFDVCIVPHLESAFTQSLNPIKLWEYLACGKPIVSTDVAGFASYPRLCRIASGPEPFIQACREALQVIGSPQAQELKRQRREEASHHSWEARLDDLLAAMGEARLL